MRSIIHLDADAFFASVEQAADARLRDRPVAVGGEKRGVVVSASYEARRLGVRTPVSTALARRLCPSMIIVPGDFEKYERFSRWMFSYAYDFTPNVEIGSIDEGYFDLSGVGRPAAEVADKIRQAIRQSLKISVSEGIASNKLVSQIASKFKKPGAFEFVPHGNEVRFIHPLPNIWLPGVGPGTAGRLNAAGLASIGHVARAPAELLALLVGSAADGLREYAKGVDTRPVVPQAAPAKSYGCQETFDEDTIDEGFVRKVIRCMAERLMRRVRGDDVSARTVTLRVRYNDMEEDTASESLCEPTNLESDVYGVLDRLLRRAWRRRVSVRLVGVKLSNLYPALFAQELPLGDGFGNGDAKRRLAEAVDSVRTVYGRRAVVRGYDLPEPRRSEVNSEGMRRARNVSVVREGGRFKPGLSSKKIRVSAGGKRQGWKRTAAYAPLCVHSFYSFLNSTLSIESIIELAQRNEVKAVALTDQGNLHGAVEFYRAARAVGIKPVIGAEVRWRGSPLRLYVADGDGYRNLCRLLSQMHGASGYDLSKIRAPAVSGLIAVGTNPEPAAMFGDGFYLGVQSPGRLRGGGLPRDIPAVACMPVHYGVPGDRLLFDVVQSIRTRTLLRHAHPLKRLGGDFHFRAPTEVSEIFSDYPALVERSNEIVERCSFEFPELPLQFPGFSPPDGSAPRDFLRRLVDAGFRRRYPDNPGELRGKLEEELNVIHEVGYEEYFLVVWDLLIECRRRG
ncbi:MAG: PHP domain-containing protein, partial [Verrucomicrobia bacterium]|nr:PHP domain-containing protein [Verrucomicrobiota bacterium]